MRLQRIHHQERLSTAQLVRRREEIEAVAREHFPAAEEIRVNAAHSYCDPVIEVYGDGPPRVYFWRDA